MYRKTILDNGLRIITHHMPHMESVALGIWINVGARFENKKNNGIAHFLEHLLFKGTKKYSCKKLKESIEGVGGSLNGFTSEEFCCYLARLPAEYLDLAVDILSDMVLNPLLPAKEIEKERGVIIEEIKMHRDLPQSYVHQLLDELLWPEQPLGMNIIGTDESVRRISRRDLFLFKEKCYTAANIVISACGNLHEETLLKRIETIFGELKTREKNKFRNARERQTKPRLNILSKDTEQTHLAMGFHGLRRQHPDRYALGLLHVILGANMSSRLFSQVREKKGLAYEIGTHIKYFADTGAFIISAGIDNRKTEETFAVILKELTRIKKVPVSRNEFKRAKDFYIGQLALSLEDTLNHMLWIGESMTALDKTYTLEEVKNEVNRVQREDLMRISQEIFKEKNINLAFIGPLKNKEKELYGCLKFS